LDFSVENLRSANNSTIYFFLDGKLKVKKGIFLKFLFNLTSIQKFEDPMNLFQIAPVISKCNAQNCSHGIDLKRKLTMLTQYAMELQLVQTFADRTATSLTAQVNVIIKKPARSLDYFPKFSKLAYEFIINEDIKPNTLARNVSILVQSDYQTDFSSGFSLELLNSDNTPASGEPFELVPNYGVGFLVASLKVKSALDYEKGNRRYDFVVST
jgi:hypothetical protein